MPVHCLLALCLIGSIALAAQQQGRISRITVHNNYLVSRDRLLESLGIAEGDPYVGDQVEQAVRQWNEDGRFGTIAYRVEPAEGGDVGLVISVSERLRLTGWQFRGNRHFSDKRLTGLLELESGQSLGRVDAGLMEGEIADLYRNAGFPLVQVRAQIEAEAAGGNLVFYVSEGPRVWVRAVIFEGLRNADAKALRKEMSSNTRGFVSFLWPGWFRREVFDADIRAVEAACRGMGYLDARVAGYVEYGPELEWVDLRLSVDEGRLYTVRAVTFDGNTVYRDDELRDALPFVPGEPYRPEDAVKAVDIVEEMYGNQGYMDVTPEKGSLLAEPVFDVENAQVTLRVRIDEGEPVFIRRVEIRGLTKTRESVVRRNLSIYPGERADLRKIKESERLLLNTGYFDMASPAPVDIFLEPDEGTVRDAVVRVQEGDTGRFLIGAGIGSESGVLGEISLVEENFDIGNWPDSWHDMLHGNALRGGGQKLTLVLRTGTERSYYSIGFLNPAVQDSDYSFGAEIYSAGVVHDEYDETRTGFSFSRGRRLSRYKGIGFTAGYESVEVDDVSNNAAPQIRRDRGSHSKPFVRFRAYVDRLDNRFMPTEGYTASAEVEVAAADVETVKVVLDGRRYWTVREERNRGKHVVGLRGRVGMVDSYGGHVPVFERFYAGGFSTLRGFDYEGVSPIDPGTGDQIGGEGLLVGSAEYSVPISEDDRVRWVMFMDAGYVTEDVEEVLSGWDELRVSVGTGLRWQMPALGPAAIEVDIAVPIMKESGDETKFFHFSIGAFRTF